MVLPHAILGNVETESLLIGKNSIISYSICLVIMFQKGKWKGKWKMCVCVCLYVCEQA